MAWHIAQLGIDVISAIQRIPNLLIVRRLALTTERLVLTNLILDLHPNLDPIEDVVESTPGHIDINIIECS